MRSQWIIRLCILWGAALASVSAADVDAQHQLHGSKIGGERRIILRREQVEGKMLPGPPERGRSVDDNKVAPASALVATGPLKTRVVSLESSVSELLTRTISLEDEVLGRIPRDALDVAAATHRGAAGNGTAAATAGLGRLALAAQSRGSFVDLPASLQMERLQGLLEQVPTTQLAGTTTLPTAGVTPFTTTAPPLQTTVQATTLAPALPATAESQSSGSLYFLLLAIFVCLVLCGVLMHRRISDPVRRSTIRAQLSGGTGELSPSDVIRRDFTKPRLSTVGGLDGGTRRSSYVPSGGARASTFGGAVDAVTRRSKYNSIRESRGGNSQSSQSPVGTPRRISSGQNSAGSGGGSGGSATPPLERSESGQTRYSQRKMLRSGKSLDVSSGSGAGTGSGSKNTTPPIPDLSDASVGSAAP